MCVHSSASRCHGDRSSHFVLFLFFFLSQELSSLSYLFPGRKQIAKTADAADAWFVYTHKYIYVLCRREEQQQPVAKDKDSWTELDRGGYVRWLYISIRRDDDGCHVRKASRDFVIYKHNTLRGGQTFCTCLAKTAANTRRWKPRANRFRESWKKKKRKI